MSDMTDPDQLEPVARTCQIIIAALIMGVVTFLAIVLIVVPTQVAAVPAGGGAVPVPGNPASPLITYLALAVGLVNLALAFVVPDLIATRARRQIAQGMAKLKGPPSEPKQIDLSGDAAALAQVYLTQLIIGAALLEGAAFLAAIAYMLERQPMAVGMALVLLVVLASRFPTRDRIAAWLDRQLERLKEERQSTL